MSVVAIDGPASSGKSSVGIRVAAALGCGFLDTGLLYRAVTAAALVDGALADEAALTALAGSTSVHMAPDGVAISVAGRTFDSASLESAAVERAVPAVAAIPSVRAALRSVQRAAAAGGSGVLAGRDIGTVVLPEADWKFFLDASAESRALRRARQRGYAEGSAEHQSILADLIARDREDRERAVAPLVAAPDAILVATDDLSLDQVVDRLVETVRRGA